MNIRSAELSDLNALQALRNHYVKYSNATFSEVELSLGDIEAWYECFTASGPYRLLVAEETDQIVGYAHSQRYRAGPAFRTTVETSIYVSPDSGGKGVGTDLYTALFREIAGERLHRAVAGIALPNEASVNLHKKFGFMDVGVFSEYAVKNGQYISSLWMEKPL
jgi:phosphinothricin acetyltransferase